MSAPTTIPTSRTPDVCTFEVLVDGTDVAGQYQILSIEVARELNRIPVATIKIKDGEAARGTFPASDTDQFVPGAKIEIRFGYRSENTTVFKGMVVRHSIRVRKKGSLLIVECKDDAVKLTQGAKSACFLETKDSDAMEDLIEAHGLTSDVDDTGYEQGSIVQYKSTDWDFLVCRAEANGMVVSVVDGKVSVKKPELDAGASVVVAYGSTLIELDAEIDARVQSDTFASRAWSSAEQAILEIEANEPTPPDAGNLTAETLAGVLGEASEIDRHGGTLSNSELQAWADGQLLRQRLARIRGRASFQGFAGVVPGGILQVDGIGQRFAGLHYVAGTRQSLANGNWQTDVEFGIHPDRFAERFDVDSLPASGLLPAAHGLQFGVVTGLEGDPQGEDRIQVLMPLVGDGDEGIWMRLATLDAGSNRGTFFRPEIGDEVVVGFIDEDPRYPVVLGQLHSSAHPTPDPLSNANALKGYVSRESLRLSFDDQNKQIELATPAGKRLLISESEGMILIEDGSGNSYAMSSSGVELSSSSNITLKASGSISIEGATVSVKGSAQTSIQGGLVQIN